jgi:hypothetical protein
MSHERVIPIPSWHDIIYSYYPGIFAFRYPFPHNPWEWRPQGGSWIPIPLEQPSHDVLRDSARLEFRAPMSEVRKIFEIIVVPIVSIQRALGCSVDDVKALLKYGPREEHQFIGWAGLEATDDLGLDISIRQVQIL